MRDKYVLVMAKKTIREAGCEIHLLAENIPTDRPETVLIEGLMASMSEYHSRQLPQKSRGAWTTTPRPSRVACSTSTLRGGMQSIADELNAEGRKVRREDAEHDAQEPCLHR